MVYSQVKIGFYKLLLSTLILALCVYWLFTNCCCGLGTTLIFSNCFITKPLLLCCVLKTTAPERGVPTSTSNHHHHILYDPGQSNYKWVIIIGRCLPCFFFLSLFKYNDFCCWFFSHVIIHGYFIGGWAVWILFILGHSWEPHDV